MPNNQAEKYVYEGITREIARAAPPEHRALDFGAGFGNLTRAGASLNISVSCIEPDRRQRNALERTGFTCFESIEEVANDSQPFIYSSNVLEHIEDDITALRRLRSKLAPRGTLFPYVPAFMSIYTKVDAQIGHHRRYTKADLAKKLQAAGFAVQRMRYVDVLRFFVSFILKRVANDAKSVNAGAMQIYDSVVFPLSMLVETIISPSFGKNVLAVASRVDSATKTD